MLNGNRVERHSPISGLKGLTKLTISVDKEVLKRARVRATEQDTSVNAVLREFLSSYAGFASTKRDAMNRLIRLSREASSGHGERAWMRDELHER